MNETKLLDISKDQVITVKKSTDFNAVFRGEGSVTRKAIIRFVFKGRDIDSNINIKAALFDQSSIDLELILDIPKGSKGTNTYLKSESMIFSPEASVRVIPSLEIHEDEVKAGHAATVKRINKDHLFYMKARGISEEDAKELIVDGFLNEY